MDKLKPSSTKNVAVISDGYDLQMMSSVDFEANKANMKNYVIIITSAGNVSSVVYMNYKGKEKPYSQSYSLDANKIEEIKNLIGTQDISKLSVDEKTDIINKVTSITGYTLCLPCSKFPSCHGTSNDLLKQRAEAVKNLFNHSNQNTVQALDDINQNCEPDECKFLASQSLLQQINHLTLEELEFIMSYWHEYGAIARKLYNKKK